MHVAKGGEAGHWNYRSIMHTCMHGVGKEKKHLVLVTAAYHLIEAYVMVLRTILTPDKTERREYGLFGSVAKFWPGYNTSLDILSLLPPSQHGPIWLPAYLWLSSAMFVFGWVAKVQAALVEPSMVLFYWLVRVGCNYYVLCFGNVTTDNRTRLFIPCRSPNRSVSPLDHHSCPSHLSSTPSLPSSSRKSEGFRWQFLVRVVARVAGAAMHAGAWVAPHAPMSPTPMARRALHLRCALQNPNWF